MAQVPRAEGGGSQPEAMMVVMVRQCARAWVRSGDGKVGCLIENEMQLDLRKGQGAVWGMSGQQPIASGRLAVLS